jgi:hypothetical protein
MRVCKNCNGFAYNPIRCSKCTSEWYCNNTCRQKNWNEHKFLCGRKELFERPTEPAGCGRSCCIQMQDVFNRADIPAFESAWCSWCFRTKGAVYAWFHGFDNGVTMDQRKKAFLAFHQRLQNLCFVHDVDGTVLEVMTVAYKGRESVPDSGTLAHLELFFPLLLKVDPEAVLQSKFPRRFYADSRNNTFVEAVSQFFSSVAERVLSVIKIGDLVDIVLSYYVDRSHPGKLASHIERLSDRKVHV